MYCSFHPHHIKSSIVLVNFLDSNVFVQIFRTMNIKLKFSLKARGFPYKLISEQINRASHITPTKSLTCNSNEKTNEKGIITTPFHPSIATFFLKVNKDWLNNRTDNCLSNTLSSPIIFANKQRLNLQQLLTCFKNIFLQCNQPCHKQRC